MKSRPAHLARMAAVVRQQQLQTGRLISSSAHGQTFSGVSSSRIASSEILSQRVAARSLAFHTSSRSLNSEKKDEKKDTSEEYAKKSKEEKEARRSHVTDTPQSPFRVFVDTLKEELQRNRELQDDVAKLQGDVDKLADSEAMRKAKEAYERARITNILKNNPRLAAAAEDLRKAGHKVSDGVSEAMRAVEESEFMRQLTRASSAVATGVSQATAPVRNTAAYKALEESITEAFDESSRYGGYEEKEERRRRRELRAAKAGRSGKTKRQRVEENPEAGQALVATSEVTESSGVFDRLRSSPTYLRWQEAYHESENPLVGAVRSVTSAVGRFFDENETARVIRMIKQQDPDFQMEAFARELREYIIPEVVDAYLHADQQALKMWCGEATYNVLWATMQQYIKQGLVSDSKVLDIRDVDISTGKILENDVPVFLVTFSTQEILLFRHAKTGEVVVGNPNGVEMCRYAAVLTLVEAEMDNPETNGWKIVEMARRGAGGYV